MYPKVSRFFLFFESTCVFGLGILKENYGFRRFLVRGKQNIETQFFLLAFAFNIEKLCNRAKKERKGQHLFCLEED